MDPGRIDPDLIARFEDALDRLWVEEDSEDVAARRLGLAVSGGPDSLALLLLAAAVIPGQVAVCSIDHGLREDAAREIALVEAACAALAVPFTALAVSPGRGNLQAKAREARYAALGEWARREGITTIATAHHADDQAETLLMRLARGSGLAGLAGVRESTCVPGSDIGLIRPLLWARKGDLEAAVHAAGLEPARDPSNADPAFDRVRVREHLRAHDWLDAEALAASAGHLAEALRAIEWYAEQDWEEMVTLEEASDEEADGSAARPGGPIYVYYANVPRIVQIETVCRIVSAMGGRVSRSEAGRAADRLWRGENASLGGVLAVPAIENVAEFGGMMRVWRFRQEPARRTH
ncbi:tRNA lysidine(34) synthetase TilS [Qipengyuania nanhaisediminis]|uniref:tRNA lysidine(34) synthetase TilS n=1 Tax=Qipengyuania nanhaisediminis TaxID=604088 RepID=UPI0038B25435